MGTLASYQTNCDFLGYSLETPSTAQVLSPVSHDYVEKKKGLTEKVLAAEAQVGQAGALGHIWFNLQAIAEMFPSLMRLLKWVDWGGRVYFT